jgi:hypothetical protein
VVTGDIDPSALDDLVRLCLQLTGHGLHCMPALDPAASPNPAPGPGPAAGAAPAPAGPSGLDQLSGLSREAIEQAIIRKAADLMSGPGGLASFLRTRQLGARLAGPSRPLDIGYSTTIPPGHPQRCHPARPPMPLVWWL